MNTYLLETYGMRLLDGALAGDDPLRRRVCELLSGLYPAGPFERRREQRFPFPKLIRLTPVAADGATAVGPVLVVSGKHLSESGLSFFHPAPLAYRLVVASLERVDCGRSDFLLDVDWCRYTQLGWYESGGKFLRAVDGEPAASRTT